MGKEAAHRTAQGGERGSGKVEESRVQTGEKLTGWPGHGSHGGHAEEHQLLEGSR